MRIKVFDEHHEAFLYWETAALQKKIKKEATLLHVDFHSDDGVPHFLKTSVYSKNIRQFTQEELSIGNFIIPSILRGTIKKVIFLHPFFASKAKRMEVGSLKGEGKAIVAKQKFKKLTRILFPDIKEWSQVKLNDVSKVKEQDVILDIDLDYFSCNLFPILEFKLKLSKQQLKSAQRFSTSQDDFRLKLNYFNLKRNYLSLFKIPRIAKDELIYNDSFEWIDYSIKKFVRGLRVRPLLVSICRSEKSGYLPKKYAKLIEERLIKYLCNPPKNIEFPSVTHFRIFPFIASADNFIYNVYTKRIEKLNKTSLFFWNQIKEGRDFDQILRKTLTKYDVDREVVKQDLLSFVFYLKQNVIIS